MSKAKALKLSNLLGSPRVLVLIAPFILLSPIWLTGKALYWGTPSTQFIPWWVQAWETLRAGQLPLWNPMLGMGAPLLANYQSGLLYPPNWLYFLLAWLGGVPWMAWGQSLLVASHLAWSGLGMLSLVRRMGLGIFAQTTGGLAFALSGYLVARAHFLSINAAVAWLPWILLAVYDLVQKPTRRGVLTLSLLFALQWLAGHAQIAWYSLLLTIVWALFWAWRKERWPTVGRVGLHVVAAGIVALALSAVQLLPTFEYLLHSARAALMDSHFAFNYSFWPWRFITILAPNFFGNPAAGDYWGYGNYWEDAVYIGLLPLILAVFALLKNLKAKENRSLFRFLFAAILFSFLLALGEYTALFPWLYRNIPTFDLFQAPTRFTLWAVTALALMAAYGATAWRRPIGRALYWSRLSIAAAISILLGAGLAEYLRIQAIMPFSAIEPTFLKALFSFGLILLAIAYFNLRAPEDKTGNRRWKWMVLVLVTADLLWAGWGLNPGVDLDFYRAENYDFSAVRQDLGEGRVYMSRDRERVLKFERFFRFDSFETGEPPETMRETLLPNLTLLSNIPSANNFDPLLPARYQDWIDSLESVGEDVQEDMLTRMAVTVVQLVGEEDIQEVSYSQLDALPRLRWLPCARTVSDFQQALELIAAGELDPNLEVAVENPDSASSETCEPTSVEEGRVGWVLQSPNRLLVSVIAPKGGWLVLADTYFPGWIAHIEGVEQSIYPADALFRAVNLPEGSYELEFVYRPLSFTVGASLSAVAWIALFLAWRRSKQEENI